jgi:hypothetical protein
MNLVVFLVLVVFWVGIGFAFGVLGARSALAFIGLCILGIAIFALLHLQPYFFVAYEALLAAILFIMLQREWA